MLKTFIKNLLPFIDSNYSLALSLCIYFLIMIFYFGSNTMMMSVVPLILIFIMFMLVYSYWKIDTMNYMKSISLFFNLMLTCVFSMLYSLYMSNDLTDFSMNYLSAEGEYFYIFWADDKSLLYLILVTFTISLIMVCSFNNLHNKFESFFFVNIFLMEMILMLWIISTNDAMFIFMKQYWNKYFNMYFIVYWFLTLKLFNYIVVMSNWMFDTINVNILPVLFFCYVYNTFTFYSDGIGMHNTLLINTVPLILSFIMYIYMFSHQVMVMHNVQLLSFNFSLGLFYIFSFANLLSVIYPDDNFCTFSVYYPFPVEDEYIILFSVNNTVLLLLPFMPIAFICMMMLFFSMNTVNSEAEIHFFVNIFLMESILIFGLLCINFILSIFFFMIMMFTFICTYFMFNYK